ncbi:receptor-interacting serine/threonine-protein kinase 3 [Engraulis encrasicolus]|uniref:receptor-interacting serine/threonine-protein kinase 3 n=1 Tax=Engraulis encrasicolus TaxID=184585 RepID=UPI002FCEEED9
MNCKLPSILIRDSSLSSWEVIGSGGFGQIYRTKHERWGMDVAIKVLHHSDGSECSPLLNEAELMRQGSSPFVLRILGVYSGHPATRDRDRDRDQGWPPYSSSPQLGLVMEYMERGSLAGLQEALEGPPPWPLAFRFAHQVALGMNFLHCMMPPLLHLDLKPSNVLLDSDLNAKLTDFGLARLALSISKKHKDSESETGGTISYMPPEAFHLSYKPTPASDVYSYGVLLWSIFTGKEPYPYANSSLVRFRIPLGDRPELQALDMGCVEGLGDMAKLMEKCWAKDLADRPSFEECHPVTKRLYDLHKRGISDAVYLVQKKLDSDAETSFRNSHSETVIAPPVPLHASIPVSRERTPQQETGGQNPQLKSKTADSIERHPHQPIKSHTPAAPEPITANPERQRPPYVVTMSNQKSSKKAAPTPSILHYMRQSSTPVSTSGYVSICGTDLSFVQIGNNNSMHVSSSPRRPRHRNPTAPSRVGMPAAQADHRTAEEVHLWDTYHHQGR